MGWSRYQIRLRTWLALVALFAVCASVVSREAKLQRGAITSGDVLVVEVLETLPGYPITGEYRVRANGCIELGYYGSLLVTDLTVDALKTRLIGRLRKFLSDEALDLIADSEGPVDPARSTSVFVDTLSYHTETDFILSTTFLDYINNFCRLGGHQQVVPVPRYSCCLYTPATPEQEAIASVRDAIQTRWDFKFRPLPIIAGLWLLRKRIADKLAFLFRSFFLITIKFK